MTLKPGVRMGPYQVETRLGKGGMGEVWAAHDTRLNRTVAIKVCAAGLSERFRDEALAIASLNHPHICHLYDVGPDYLVMELVEGAPPKGPMPAERALKLAADILSALDAAHRKGIVHGDLKPDNILVSKQQGVKLLDFGLARLESPAGALGEADLNGDATLRITRPDVAAGTLPYMAPEQFEGRKSDARADIYSFGVVMYELLAGKRPFDLDTPASLVAAVLRDDPPPLPPSLPPALESVVRTCLAKDPDERWQTARDLRREILRITAEAGGRSAAHPNPNRRWLWVGAGVLLAGLVLALSLPLGEWRRGNRGTENKRHFLIAPEAELLLAEGTSLALSPDGKNLAYVAGSRGSQAIYLRPIDQTTAWPLPGTQGGRQPFFSPDGKSLGFIDAGNWIRTVSLTGGPPAMLCEASSWGASWGSDGYIYFVARGEQRGLARVPAAGGVPEPLPGRNSPSPNARWVAVLPDSSALLFTDWNGSNETASIIVQSLKTGERRTLGWGSSPRYSTGGYLVFGRRQGLSSTVWSAPFDAAKLQAGPAVPLTDGVRLNAGGAAHFSLSKDGMLAYVKVAPGQPKRLLRVDRKGRSQPLSSHRRHYRSPRFSPDGRFVAVSIVEGTSEEIWILDVARDVLTPLTSDGGVSEFPVWSPDGKWIAFSSRGPQRPAQLFRIPASGGSPEPLMSPGADQFPQSWSPDGRYLLFSHRLPSGMQLWVLPLDGARQPKPLVQTATVYRGGVFSPEGYLAYISDAGTDNNVYVRQFPDTGSLWRTSMGGGEEAAWSRRGELFYRQGDKHFVVRYRAFPVFAPDVPEMLFEGRFETGGTGSQGHANYDVAPDGQSFVFLDAPAPRAQQEYIHIVTGWAGQLRAQMERKK